jgi:hypothetical protein
MSILNPLSWFTQYNEYHVSMTNSEGMNYWNYCNGLNNFLNSWLINNNQPHLNGMNVGSYTIDGIENETGNLNVTLFIPKNIKISSDAFVTYTKNQTGLETHGNNTNVGGIFDGPESNLPILNSLNNIHINQGSTNFNTKYTYEPYINIHNGKSSEKLKNGDYIRFME